MIAGLTGGIGSGKSTVARVFEMLGWAVFDSDSEAKKTYSEPGVKAEVINLLGEKSYVDGNLNKEHVSASVFGHPELLQRLNAIVHPAVRSRFQTFLKENPATPILKETALLFEANLTKEVDAVILVVSDEELRIDRVIRRSGLSSAEVKKIMEQQWPDEKKIAEAAHVIYNDEKQLVLPQVLAVHQKLTSGC